MSAAMKRTLRIFLLALGLVALPAFHFPRVWPGVVLSAFLGATNAMAITYRWGTEDRRCTR